MAVICELPGIKVTIEVNGLKAQEYDNQDDGPAEDKNKRHARHCSHKYIESQDDAQFSIVYEVDNVGGWLADKEALGFYAFIDGDRMDGVLWEASRDGTIGSTWRYAVEGKRVGSSSVGMHSIRKFKFSKVTTVDDVATARVETDIKVAKSLGMIQVFIYSVAITGPRHPNYLDGSSSAGEKDFEVAEKALKGRAVSHGTSYTDGGLIPQSQSVPVAYKDKKPIGAFNFKYRSRNALHKELVIPRSPTPNPQGIEGLSEAEIRRLAAERLEDVNHARRSPTMKRESKGPVIKREHAEFYDLTEEPAKREWKKVKVDGQHKVIDLTDD